MESIRDVLRQQKKSKGLDTHFQAQASQVFNHPAVQQFLHHHQLLPEDAVVKRSIAVLNEYRLELDKRANKQPVKYPLYDPVLTYAPNEGISLGYQESERAIERRRDQEAKRRLKSMYLPQSIREANFAQADKAGANRPDVVMALMECVAQLIDQPTKFQPGLYLHGAFGVGKTYLLAATANALSYQGYKVTLVHWPSFIVELKSSIQDNSISQKLDALKKSRILMIDDIGAESNSEWVRDDILMVVLQYRMDERLTTFFSSNFSMADLALHLASTRNQDNVVKAERIMERIKFLSREQVTLGRNRRHG